MNYPQRMYSKTELGLLYFPDTTDGATARRHIHGMDQALRAPLERAAAFRLPEA